MIFIDAMGKLCHRPPPEEEDERLPFEHEVERHPPEYEVESYLLCTRLNSPLSISRSP